MPGRSFPVEVNPDVLRWARETGGYTLAEAGERIGSQEEIQGWESGKARPPWRSLKGLAQLYKRPVTALLLPSPPSEPPLPPDFRTLPAAAKTLSPGTRQTIRTARWLASTAAELEQQLGTGGASELTKISLFDNPERVAERCRHELGISLEEQAAWPSVSQAFRRWRAAIEARHVFVFQFKMPVEEVRGFSLFEAGRGVIVLNQSDHQNARIFTLFHEFCHLSLAKPGICLPDERVIRAGRKTETFCNRFAAALLVPASDLQTNASTSVLANVGSLANQYSVSRAVILGRLRTLGSISKQTYEQALRRIRPKPPSKRPQKGGPSVVSRVFSERGSAFVSLVLDAAKRELITSNDVTSYLGVKLKHLPRIEARTE